MSRPRLERAGAIAIGVLVLAFALLTQVVGEPPESVQGSVASTQPEGRRALFLLFGSLGYVPEAWRKFPGALPPGEHVVWLASAPRASDSGDEDGEDDEDDEADEPQEDDPARERLPHASLDFRSLRHYRRFVESGGTIVLPFGPRAKEFLVEDLGCEPCREIERADNPEWSNVAVHTSSGETWSADWGSLSTFESLDPASDVRELWRGGPSGEAEEERLALQVPLGDGRVIVLGDDAFLENEKLGAKDHAILAVSLFEEVSRGGRLLFDEFAIGLWEASTPIAIATGPSLVLATAHVLVLLLLLAWRAGWTLRFPRDPVPLAQASPILRARSLASLLVRSGRYDVLTRLLRSGVLRSLSRKLRVSTERTERLDTAASVDSIARRAGIDATSAARWRELFTGPAGTSAVELEALGDELARLETQVDARVGRLSATPARAPIE